MEQWPGARFFAVDEARFGLKTWFRRRWCPCGVRPPWVVQDRYEWLWLYAAVEPATGESVCLLLPCLDRACVQIFLDELRHAYPAEQIVVVSDRAGSHTSGRVEWPQGITSLPAYSPELDPAERWFEVLRGALANQVFEGMTKLEASLCDVLPPFWDEPAKLAWGAPHLRNQSV